ncbi:Spy/CpxP family protein refolding chaperone [uncultured Polaribacter sp.]|uniref:Spy/CpxP family protein refolding chaperone n=1 Tax=uncultured Polaribacter sp. TaxID=174711 RepID=UPI00262C90A9|nr:Spy/CpxP family protein refolding chaperone [uncultured Polaribacter sp.]
MKNIVTVLVLVFAFTFTTQAQKKGGKPSAEKMLMKMTKDLNLTEDQQNQIKPLLVEQIADRKAAMEKRKAFQESGEKPSKEERKAFREERMTKQTAMHSKLANILNEEQLAKFDAQIEEKKEKAKNRIKKIRE